MSNTLYNIDYCCNETRRKQGKYNTEKNIANALKLYINNYDSSSFTRNNNARNIINSLDKESIIKELLINLVKKYSYSQSNGYATLLNTKKGFDDDYSFDEGEFLIIKTIKENKIEVIEYLLNKYPKLLSLLIDSFVSSRYFDVRFGITELDNQQIIPLYNDLINKINSYYDDMKTIVQTNWIRN